MSKSLRVLDKLPELMKDPKFAAAWEEAKEEFTALREDIRRRAAADISQNGLAEKTGATQNEAIATWLREEVVPAYDALKTDPSRGLTIDRVLARLEAEHANYRKA
jgi:hypothetical protein